jgi:hypothetical protein
VELWLTICDFLKPSDRRSLAWTCRTLFGLLNTRAPFTVLKLKAKGFLNLIQLHRHSRTLLFANEVHWQGSQRPLWRSRSANPLTLAGPASRFIFTTLLNSKALRCLKLFRVEVTPDHQRAIVSIPTLRDLTLQESLFVPTNNSMPHTSITSLSFKQCGYAQAPVKHILNLLAGSLDTLALDATPLFTHPFMGTIQLPRLVHLRHLGIQWFARDMAGLSFQSTITTLFLASSTVHQIGAIPLGILPQLRELSAPCPVGKQLIPGRPVTCFRDTSLTKALTGEIDEALSFFAQSTIGLTNLEICTELAIPSLFMTLERRVPRIERFRLLTESDTFRHNPSFNTRHKNEVGTGAAALKEVEIRFRAWADCHKPPIISTSNCRTIFEALERACPALEVVTFTVVGAREKFEKDENDLPPQSIYKLCKTGAGTWEERRSGTYISAEDTLHACSPRRM